MRAFSTLLFPSSTTRLTTGPCAAETRRFPGAACCAKALSAAVIPAISALIAIMAVVAGFFRRGVVVDIINWPVSLYSVLAGKAPQVGNECPQPYPCDRLY